MTTTTTWAIQIQTNMFLGPELLDQFSEHLTGLEPLVDVSLLPPSGAYLYKDTGAHDLWSPMTRGDLVDGSGDHKTLVIFLKRKPSRATINHVVGQIATFSSPKGFLVKSMYQVQTCHSVTHETEELKIPCQG